MKRVISFFLSFIIFIIITLLGLIFSIHLLIRENVIKKETQNISYLELVDIKAEEGEVKKNYDEFYLSLEEVLPNHLIKKLYESKIPSRIMRCLLLNEIDYIFNSFDTKVIDEEIIQKIVDEEMRVMGLNDSDRASVLSVIGSNSYRIINMEEAIRKKINSFPKKSLLLVRYFCGYPFKIILLCILTIAIIMEFLINKRNYLPYIFIPTIISGVLSIFISIFMTTFIKSRMQEFLFILVRFFISSLSDSLLVIGLMILFISILSLMFNEIIIKRGQVVIKPRLKMKRL